MPKSKQNYKRKMKLRKRKQDTYKWSQRRATSMSEEEKVAFVKAVKEGMINAKLMEDGED